MNQGLSRKGISLSSRKTDVTLFIIMALVAFLMTLTAVTAFGAFTLSSQWQRESLPIITIQIPDGDLPDDKEILSSPQPTRVQSVIQHLSVLPKETQIHRLNNAEVNHLLEPLLGNTEHDSLPLPVILRIKLPSGAHYPGELDGQLAKDIPGTLTERGTSWEKHLQTLAYRLLLYTKLSFIPVGIVVVLMAAFAINGTILLHEATLRTMHFLGAKDSFLIWRQSVHNGLIGFYSGILGCFLANIPLCLFIKWGMPLLSNDFISGHVASVWNLIEARYFNLFKDIATIFLTISALTALLCIFVTWFFVRRALRRYP